MRVLILEDDIVQAAGLKKYVLEYQPDWEVFVAADYENAVMISESQHMQLFLLDIELRDRKNGLDFGKYLRTTKNYSGTPVIFLTSKEQYMLAAINEIHCYGFLPKPYDKNQLFLQLSEISQNIEKTREKIPVRVVFKDENGIAFPVFRKDIYAVLSVHRRLKICTGKGEYMTCYLSLSEARKKLPFMIQIRRDCMINPDFIDNYDCTNYYIRVHNITYPVGRGYKENLDRLLR